MSNEIKQTQSADIKVEVTRNYGNHSVTFGMTRYFQLENEDQRRNAFDVVYAELEDQVLHYEKYHLANVMINHNVSTETQDVFKVEKIVIENKGGKRMINVRGGRWVKHGVPLYPDNEAFDKLSDKDYGVLDWSRFDVKACAEMQDGKPKRILWIRSNV